MLEGVVWILFRDLPDYMSYLLEDMGRQMAAKNVELCFFGSDAAHFELPFKQGEPRVLKLFLVHEN